jgi:hypothetical protein
VENRSVSRAKVDLVRSSFEALGGALVEDGRIKRVEEYRTVEEALAAAGPPAR